ncbi:restriction system-associated AAA family ATPase [Bizionia paragorgiae]|uniref:restriction system-associated AAA family ATPase n=1 Tax=Bizionia paragorgiae TaxID=283786 RepID=UPI003A8E8BDA
MQLVRVKLLSDFRSLKKNFEMKFSQEPIPDSDQLISPICLVGKNGTGKSNFMELICEIFYYLDSQLLDYPSESLLEKKRFGFELEYKFDLTFNDAFETWKAASFSWNEAQRHVKVVKKVTDEEPSYYLIDQAGNETNVKRRGGTKRELKQKIKLLLPNKVIGYSSGLNELISNPFLKMQFHYFHEYQSRLEEDVLDDFDDGKLFFMNYESNASVVVSNFLLQEPEKLEVLDETVEIAELDSFRIVIELGNSVEISPDARSTNERADLTDFFKKEIQWLKQIATTLNEEILKDVSTGEERVLLKLDYKVNSSTKVGFKHFFGDTNNLYSFFHKMHLLNLFKLPPEKRELVRNAVSGMNISDLLPKLASDQQLFRIDRIRLVKSETNKLVEYKSISDGEHQFMHIVGTSMIMNQHKSLFILDEPETHFNPKWRSKLVSTLNKVEKAEVAIHKKENQTRISKAFEVILSTHSPFILSDSYRSKVWKFVKEKDEPKADIIQVKTYGTSFSVLLEEAFDKTVGISEMSEEYIDELRKKIESIELAGKNAKKTIEELQQKVLALGESVNKFELYSYLNRLLSEVSKK